MKAHNRVKGSQEMVLQYFDKSRNRKYSEKVTKLSEVNKLL